MKNLVLKYIIDKTSEATEQEAIVERSVDLVNNDPLAGGLVENLAASTLEFFQTIRRLNSEIISHISISI